MYAWLALESCTQTVGGADVGTEGFSLSVRLRAGRRHAASARRRRVRSLAAFYINYYGILYIQLYSCTTSVQLNIINPRGGVKTITKTAN